MYRVPFEVADLTYDEALEQLHSALRFGICPMLETVEDMLAELGDPDLRYDCVQIAGTRRAAAGERPYDVTEFDTLTVAAAVVFAEAGVDVAVLECGMGGRWDATSAMKSIRSVAVTGIGLDHTRILGDTLEAIAGEKAAIIKPGRACVLGVGCATPTSVEDVFLEQCRAAGVTPTWPARCTPASRASTPTCRRPALALPSGRTAWAPRSSSPSTPRVPSTRSSPA